VSNSSANPWAECLKVLEEAKSALIFTRKIINKSEEYIPASTINYKEVIDGKVIFVDESSTYFKSIPTISPAIFIEASVPPEETRTSGGTILKKIVSLKQFASAVRSKIKTILKEEKINESVLPGFWKNDVLPVSLKELGININGLLKLVRLLEEKYIKILIEDNGLGIKPTPTAAIIEIPEGQLTRTEMAKFLHVHTRTIQNYDKKGYIRKNGPKWTAGIKKGVQVFYSPLANKDAIDDYFKNAKLKESKKEDNREKSE